MRSDKSAFITYIAIKSMFSTDGPKFLDDDYYDKFTDKSMSATTGVNKTVFNELCKIACVGCQGSNFPKK